MTEQIESRGLYYVMPSEIMDSQELNPLEKLTYILLSGLANRNATCFPSDDYLSKRLNTSTATMQRVVKKLDDLGLIDRSHTCHPDNKFKKRRIITVHKGFKKSLRNITSDHSGNITSDGLGDLTSDQVVSEVYIESKDNVRTDKSALPSAKASEVASFFLEKILEIKPNFRRPTIKKWEEIMDKIIRIDKRSPEQIRSVIEWTMSNDFWRKNILSPEKLRVQLDRLEMQMKEDGDKNPNTKIKQLQGWIKEHVDEDLVHRGDISLGYDYIHFTKMVRGMGDDAHIKFTHPQAVEKIKHCLKKIRRTVK